MEKLSINRLLLFCALLTCAGLIQFAHAAKVARLSINELKDYAKIVALVEVAATEMTDKPYRQIHTTVETKLIAHQAKIMDVLKGKFTEGKTSFLHMTGLKAGQIYLVFLSDTKDGGLIVSNNRYGAFAVSVVSMKSGVLQGVRIPESYISLPKALIVEPGASAKNEQSSFVWVGKKELIAHLKKGK